MVGVAVIVLVMVVIGPVAVFLGGAVWSALFGWFLAADADQRFEGRPS